MKYFWRVYYYILDRFGFKPKTRHALIKRVARRNNLPNIGLNIKSARARDFKGFPDFKR